MKKSLKSILVLVCICAAVAVLMALTNSITEPIIKENEQKLANAALLEVLPEGGSFELVDISSYTLPSTVTEVYRAEKGGHVVKLTTTGYAPGMTIMVGVAPDGTVVNSKIISSAETPAIGGVAAESFAAAAVGKDLSNIDGVDTVSGATKTTAGYRAAIKDALNTVVILGGGSVDLRTEEEILNDNLKAALPAAEGFDKYFFVEVIEGVDAIYLSKNNVGSICVIGESFIVVDTNGKVLSECSETESQSAKKAIETVKASKVSELKPTDYTLPDTLSPYLLSAKKTESGNFILEVKAAGYGITGGNEYHPASGEYIVIRVSLTPEGRIIDTLTVSQAETNGIGSDCAKESFYGQFDGKTEQTYNSIDAISGATMTTDGYKKAILRAFEIVKILKGGNQ